VSTLINSLRAPWLACAAAAAVSFSVSPSARTPITTEQAAPAAPQGGGQRGQSGTPPAAPQTPGGQAGRGGAGGLFPQTEPDDTEGFVPLFDGKTLSGWDGDPTFWRAENGVIVGETTPEKVVKVNNFLIWRGGTVKDFELKVEYRINSTNSGVQYRSVEMPEVGKWVLKGYQADIDFANQYTGQLYEERGRGFLALRGQMTRLLPGKKQIVADLRNSDELKALIKNNDWNQVHVIARGNVLTHIFNGSLMAQAVDDDPAARAQGGYLGFQVHQGPPMKLELRNIWLKNL